jgi:hypothetical protein
MTGIDHNENKDAVSAATQPVDESQVTNQTKQPNAPGNFSMCYLSEDFGNTKCVSRCG